MRAAALAAALLRGAARVSGHGQVVIPPSRNSVDRSLPEFAGGKWGSAFACTCQNGTHPCDTAQACLWFSQGCGYGCDTCDGVSSRTNTNLCPSSQKRATILDPRFRTFNRDAPALSPQDTYQWNPWRAPGSAPVTDACGTAGGGPAGASTAGAAVYQPTKLAKKGDLGSKLPPMPTGVVWTAGQTHETAWSLVANHGGGYQYRLCPSNANLTEQCFQKFPLEFGGPFGASAPMQGMRYTDGKDTWFKGNVVSEGTWPPGSQWMMNPIDPTGSTQWGPPTCATSARALILDYLKIPANTPPGDYVLGWRWDCEGTSQIWQACSDITIVAQPSPTPVPPVAYECHQGECIRVWSSDQGVELPVCQHACVALTPAPNGTAS